MWIDGTRIYERGKKMKWYRITQIGKDNDNDFRYVFESTDKELVEKVNIAIAEIMDVKPYKNNIQEYTVK